MEEEVKTPTVTLNLCKEVKFKSLNVKVSYT